MLASYINPSGEVPKEFSEPGYCEQQCSLPSSLTELLSQSCLVPAISSYLRNDSGTLTATFVIYLFLHSYKIYF